MTTSRERIRTTLLHRDPDRLPIDFGSTRSTGINALAYRTLIEWLGMADRRITVHDLKQLLADPSAEMLDRFQSDCVALHRLAPSAGLRIDNWRDEVLMDGHVYEVPADFHPVRQEDGSDAIVDKDGIVLLKRPAGGLYFDDFHHPFATIEDEREMDALPFPDLTEFEKQYLALRSARLRRDSDRAIVGALGVSLFEKGIKDFGYEEWLVRLMIDEPLVTAYLERLTQAWIDVVVGYASAVGSNVDVVQVNDDLGTQRAPMIPPDLYRRLIKPYQRKVYDAIHRAFPDAFLLLHSCGSILELIPDLIEIGVDALNPVQLDALGMDPIVLKREYGKDITFWGGGIRTQSTLPFGTLDEIEREVERNIEVFTPGGGFVFNPIHNIQAGTTPERVSLVYDMAIRIRARGPVANWAPEVASRGGGDR